MSRDKRVELLRHAARAATRSLFFLAGSLEEFRQNRGIDEAELARFIGCVPELLPKLALCRRPVPESGGFRSDVDRITAAFGLRDGRLVQLLREAESVKALKEADLALGEVTRRGALMAARDAKSEGSASPDSDREA